MPPTRVRLRQAVRGALGFLTRLPVSHEGRAWVAFQGTPLAFPVVGYVVGILAALPLLAFLAVGAPAPVAAAATLATLYLVTGINHLDGLADCGDAAAVHTVERRREVLKDTTTGVGALAAVGIGLAGTALGLLAVAELGGRGAGGPLLRGGTLAAPLRAAGLVVAAEVGAKLGMAAVACLGTAITDGFGAAFTGRATPGLLVGPVVVALPAALLTGLSPAAPVALLAAFATALLVVRWARARLDGVNGDVFGAANELARLAALHAGAVAWVLA
ncbi:adenosylcobinamide-GDP ribazoletransferase [Haloglomus litoreum]|uniref:adenosylcobinamide-GDP ribazoletransferase n=1 Tax=Haloglomus litoreum TaxID=3034026 RepID=UPI0023E8AA64|nr:adenosylcobinamide-GDP ribazoletransferase [Haloglomus sp. DT116]